VTDACDVVSTATQTITVSDTIPPVIVPLPNLTLSTDPGECSKSNVTWTVVASDNCAVAATNSTPPSGSTFSQGLTTVTTIVTDTSGNTATNVFTVTITNAEPAVIGLVMAVQAPNYVENCANTVVQGVVNISVQASDHCSLIGGYPAVTLTNGLATDAAVFVDQSPPGTYNYTWTVTNGTANGTWTVTVSAADENTDTTTNFTLCVNKSQIAGQLELDSFVGASRAVTFVASTNWVTAGPVTNTITLWTNTLTLSFTGGVANYTLIGVPPNANGLSAKTAWNLRKKVPVVFDINNQANAVNFTGAELLPGGDLNGDNVINFFDYSILGSNWFTYNAVADINGDGVVNYNDYIILYINWFTAGDPQ
jgi:hypothetical protein